MPKPIAELSDQELLSVAAGFPLVSDLSDEQLLAVAVHQGGYQPEEAETLLRDKRASDRAPVADAIADSQGVAAPLVRAALTRGGVVGDVAAGVIPAVGGAVLGGLTGAPTVAGVPAGVVAGGAAGGATGEALVQTRQYLRGERNEVGKGRLIGATAAAAIPFGQQVPNIIRNIARRGAQGAAVSAGAELTGQVIDEGEVDLGRLAATGALGFLFGGAVGAGENVLLRRAVLDQIRRTPEFANFKGSDADLVDAVRAKLAAEAPEPRNVTPAKAEESLLPAAPESPAPTPTADPSPVAPAAGAEQEFTRIAGVPPRVPAPGEAPVPPISSLTDEQLIAAAGSTAAEPEPQSPAAPAGVEVPSSGSAVATAETPPAAGGQAEVIVPPAAQAVTPEAEGYRLLNTYADAPTAQASIKPGKNYRMVNRPDGQVELWFKAKGRSFQVGDPPDGGSDLYTDIAELGGIARPATKNSIGFDGFDETFGKGKARLLRRREGQSPDALIEELNSLGKGYNFQSIDELYQAIEETGRTREKVTGELAAMEHEAKISRALFDNTGRASALKARKPVISDTLNVGDTFAVRGDRLKVIAIDPDTNTVTVRNGAEIKIPAGTPVYPDKGRVKKAAKATADPDMPFEEIAAYNGAQARYNALRALEKDGRLDATGQAELDAVERTLGQDFLDFYTTEKGGQPTSLGDAAGLQKAELLRRNEARLQAPDLTSQTGIFGPTTDKKGQYSLFETTANRYLDARQLKNQAARAAVRSILAGVWERRLARQLELDLGTDAQLAASIDPAPQGRVGARGETGPGDRLAGSLRQLPNAEIGAHPGGLQLEARLYTQAFLAEGFLAHTGRRFESVGQLISAAQVLRNRNVETFWVLPYDAAGRLLAPFAFSSRLPNTVDLGQDYVQRMTTLLRRLGASRFDILHNHPSGDPVPSRADRRFTQQMAEHLPGLTNHYVINHGVYSVIRPNGEMLTNQVVPEIAYQPDPTARRQGNSPYLGTRMTPENAMAIGYNLQVPQDNVTVFLLNAQMVTVATASVTQADVLAPAFPNALRELSKGVGSIGAVAYYHGNPAFTAALRERQAEGVFIDLISVDERGVVREAVGVDTQNLFKWEDKVATRVAEEPAGPAPVPEGDSVPAPTHFVSKYDRTPVPQPLAQMDLVSAVDMPELVQIVKHLAGSIPALRKLPHAHGYMRPVGRGSIVLDRRIFSDSVMATQVLAHELGHLVDYLPDLTLNRGNILGRIGTLRDHLGQSLPFDPNSGGAPLTAKERTKLRREAEKQVGKRPDPEEVGEDELIAWQKEVRRVYSEMLQAALESRGLVVSRSRDVEGGATVEGLGDVGKELRNLSFWWRPLDPNGSDSYLDYRNSSVEIYADTISVLFNAPKEFRDRAPTAWQMWFNYLDKKPEVKAELLATWDLLHQGANAVSAVRIKNLRTGFAKAEEILLEKAAERAARRNSLPAIIEHFKQKHFNVYAPIIDRARKVRAAGGRLKWWEDPEFVFDAHPLAENANYRFLDRMQKTVLSPIEAIGIDYDTLGDYLFFNRVAHESYLVGEQAAGRAVLANPLGHTPQTARRELLVMRYRLGPARFEAMQQAARRFQDLALDVIERGHAAGIYSDEQLKLATSNRYGYATFAVVDYLESSTHIPAGFKQQRGTLREVANPFLATVLKMMTALKFAELNQGKRVAVQLLSRHFRDEIDLAPVSRVPLANGRILFKAKPPPADRRELVVMDQGKPITWHVTPEIADMFEMTTPASAHAILGVTNWAFRNIFYPAFITYNPAFQLYANPIRDLSRSYVKLPPGVKRRHWLGEQLRANRGARARLINDIEGAELRRRRDLRALAARRPLTPAEQSELRLLDDRALAIEVLVHRGITTPFESFASNPMREDVWGQMLAEYRLGADTGERQAAMRKWAEHVPMLGKLLDKIEFAGQVAEAMPKIGAYRVLTRELGWTPDQAAYYVRNHVGTPNFTKKGRWTTWDGTVFPFINIFMRGLESDIMQARGQIPGIPIDPRAQRFSYWRRMAERTLVPRFLQALAAAGVLGYGLKKYYDAWSDYNKTNYLILPLGTVHDGKSDYGYKAVGLRVPEDETARLLGGVLHNIVQMAATGDDPAAKASLTNLANFAGGQVPGINPVFTLADGWVQYSAGINPRDRLRGNPVLSNTEFKAGGWGALSGMIAWTWDEVGGGNFVRYDLQANTWQQHLVGGMPILSRALKITDAGLRERQQTLETAVDTRNAKIRLAMPDNVNQLLGEYSRLVAIRRENRTPLQQARLAELSYWHSKVWTPNYETMQDSEERTWKSQGEIISQISKAFEAR